MSLPQHVKENSIAQLYLGTKYRLPLNSTAFSTLMSFLEDKHKLGGTVLINIIQNHIEVKTSERGPMNQFSFEAIMRSSSDAVDDPDLQEGIPGVFIGVSNHDVNLNNAPVKLGVMPMETDLAGDVRAELDEEDIRNPPQAGQTALVEVLDQRIKREELMDGPARTEIPLPPSRARDVVMEMQKIKEHRDRFKIESCNGGTGPAVSICMFTFHNTLDALVIPTHIFDTANLKDRICCMEFSDDTNLVACGTEDSYIRVWNLHGQPLPSIRATKAGDPPPPTSRRLIGHSAPVYAVSFSPSILGPEEEKDSDGVEIPKTHPRLLISCSADATVRLWSLEIWQCLVVYKAHDGPVWDVSWGPFGHYFASVGRDKSVRVWVQDKISYQRMMIGHDTNVNKVAWHPNGAYVFSASDQADKSVRMWSVVTGECVRVFAGHTDFISALECSPNGKILASADGAGTIILWDLAKGVQIKRCKGHGKGGIWSLSFSVESTVLASGGADGTVRIWDVEVSQDTNKHKDGEVVAVGGQTEATRITGAAPGAQAGPAGAGGSGTGAAGGSKKKGKETLITPDQLSAFPTKRTPVYKVKFTRMNLLMAGGCFNP